MLEEHLDSITQLDNFIDGVAIFDDELRCIYIKNSRSDCAPLDERNLLGKTLFQIYPHQTPETSPVYQAVKAGKTSSNIQGTLNTAFGETVYMRTHTYPIREGDKIIGAVNLAFYPDYTKTNAIDLNTGKARPAKKMFTMEDIIGQSKQIQTVRRKILRLAGTASSVLIYGATGTGKEMVAQSIHTASNRSNQPFVSQNCAAIPANLLESIFFGTCKGSYTGAENRGGIFEYADGGTIFLDEINSMDVNLQAKLLKVLEEKKFARVGSLNSRTVDVRIIAAVNEPPMECIEKKSLRADLFYRLGSVTIEIPSLAERREDILLFTRYFISQYNKVMGKTITDASQEVIDVFQSYGWPGNVRELKNVIEGAFNLCSGSIIQREDLPAYMLKRFSQEHDTGSNCFQEPKGPWQGSLKATMDAYEKQLILRAISKEKTLTAAADYLGITRQALNLKMKKYELRK